MLLVWWVDVKGTQKHKSVCSECEMNFRWRSCKPQLQLHSAATTKQERMTCLCLFELFIHHLVLQPYTKQDDIRNWALIFLIILVCCLTWDFTSVKPLNVRKYSMTKRFLIMIIICRHKVGKGMNCKSRLIVRVHNNKCHFSTKAKNQISTSSEYLVWRMEETSGRRAYQTPALLYVHTFL